MRCSAASCISSISKRAALGNRSWETVRHWFFYQDKVLRQLSLVNIYMRLHLLHFVINSFRNVFCSFLYDNLRYTYPVVGESRGAVADPYPLAVGWTSPPHGRQPGAGSRSTRSACQAQHCLGTQQTPTDGAKGRARSVLENTTAAHGQRTYSQISSLTKFWGGFNNLIIWN